MKKINLNLIKKLTPKQMKIAAIVVCCLCLVITAVIAWSYSNKEDILKPVEHVTEEIKEEQKLTLEDDDGTDNHYGAPVAIDETTEKILLNGGSSR